MGRRRRLDTRGSWHHVMNRGVARRAIFEDGVDMRYFMSRIAREVRRGSLEVHAWCFMTTHFHMLVRSPEGELSAAMRRVANGYVRHFNRRHRRDGPLFRGRFASKPVLSRRYRRVLLRYIDQNPVHARVCLRPWDYRWGSARRFITGRRAPWHEWSWVRSTVTELACEEEPFREAYARAFGGRCAAGAFAWVTASLAASDALDERFDRLVDGTPATVLGWMRWKARVADGSDVGCPVADLETVDELVRSVDLRGLRGEAPGMPGDRGLVLRAALCRTLARAKWSEIGSRMGRSETSCSRLVERYHARLLEESDDYAAAAVDVTRRAIHQMVS